MGEASANMAHWAGLYGAATGAGGNGGAAASAEGSGVTVSSPTSGGSGGGSPARSAPGVEGGRVGKPARRRSRASRRAPVTMLNTDTSNFRAMVQQFTGIPSGPYGPAGGGPVISFGAAGGSSGVGMPVRPSPSSAVMSFDHLGGQYQQQQHRPAVTSSLQQQLFRPQQHHQQQQYGGDFGAMLGGGGGGDMFLHGFESSAEDRMLLQSIQAAQMMPRPASTNNTNGYNFG
uniref:Uncharacterized protein n=1 Tax=Avena sativa TaxID=4498 RepID=A0ACD5V701_AVESA